MDCLWHAPEWYQYVYVADVTFLWKTSQSFTIKHLTGFEKTNSNMCFQINHYQRGTEKFNKCYK